MSSLISRLTETATADLGHAFGLLESGPQTVVGAMEDTAINTLNLGADLAEGYATRVGSNLLAPGILTLINSRSERPSDTVYDGMFVGANGRTYAPGTPLNQIPTVNPSNGSNTEETLIFVNGINTTKDAQAANLQAIADRTGARVIGIHNSTEGMITDLAQCVTDKLDRGNNPPVDTLADTIYGEITAGRSVHLLAHSQGGLITSRALNRVQQRLRLEDGMSRADTERLLGLVQVETFGGASGHYPDGPQYVHYINRDDPVPSLFGLGWDIDRFNPTLDAGRGAQVHWFTDIHLNPIASHSLEDVYLPRRVPFEQARRGDFD
jgi:pimeloyl-ACP methyl ester carboxylesterase